MTRLPIVDFKTMEALLVKLGFAAVRQKGSHVFYRHEDGRATTVPNHPGRDLARPLIREDYSRDPFAFRRVPEYLAAAMKPSALCPLSLILLAVVLMACSGAAPSPAGNPTVE